MQLAYTLLLAALTLLTSVSNSPNVSSDLKTQANIVATQAISYAESVINEENIPVVSSPIVQNTVQSPAQNTPASTPTFGSVTPASVPTSLDFRYNYPIRFGGNQESMSFTAWVKDQNGNNMIGKIISLTTPQGVINSNPTNQDGINFVYKPKEEDVMDTFTFASEELSTTTSIYIPKGLPILQAKLLSFATTTWMQNNTFKIATVEVNLDPNFRIQPIGVNATVSGALNNVINEKIKLFIQSDYIPFKMGGTQDVDIWAETPLTGNSDVNNLSIKINSILLSDDNRAYTFTTNSIDLPPITFQ